MNKLARFYGNQGQPSEAEPIYQQALDLCKQQLGEDLLDVAVCLSNLAKFYDRQNRYSEAELSYNQALELRQRLLGEEHPETRDSINRLQGIRRANFM